MIFCRGHIRLGHQEVRQRLFEIGAHQNRCSSPNCFRPFGLIAQHQHGLARRRASTCMPPEPAIGRYARRAKSTNEAYYFVRHMSGLSASGASFEPMFVCSMPLRSHSPILLPIGRDRGRWLGLHRLLHPQWRQHGNAGCKRRSGAVVTAASGSHSGSSKSAVGCKHRVRNW